MATRLSRRKIASYYANSLADGVDAKKLALQLAGFLVESGRVKELSLIVSEIEYHLSLKGIVVANVASAHELDDLTKKAIINLVKNSTKADQVQLREYTDSSVLGGVKLEFTGSELDTTIARRLTKLKTNFKK
jgi:F0F1-type ATP synthase delta subunit